MCHQMALEHESKAKDKAAASSPASSGSSSPAVQVPNATSGHMRDANVPIIWVLGGPGCGKGTQCEKIVAKYNFSHFSTGDLLRDEVASGSEKGKELQDMMKKGILVPNETVLKLLEAAMVKALNGTVGYLIDGYPREPAQGPEFEKFIAPVDIVLYFECSNETLVARILKRAAQSATVRADDNEETLKTRIATFRENTEKILVQYPTQLKRINAERAPEEIFADVEKAIDELLVKKGKK
ncbi:adenylate kinase isoenzyme 1 [Anopheles ziemanni]|uniref:adenylate kinase isoenzyme 1 n=1 Tax=Anopheles ziemanni TaxID=345580 RepID=UPI00265957FB|nr:adenylate kinase isoenzyme 1 isoform X2 [Anopheles coustani]XP_058166676.1 adenylate kinase isoenzyme 1 [Anopheles ziemanni]